MAPPDTPYHTTVADSTAAALWLSHRFERSPMPETRTPASYTERAFVMSGEVGMVTVQRTRDDILRELSDHTHRAGRMTVVSLGYEPTHDAINALLEELDEIDGR